LGIARGFEDFFKKYFLHCNGMCVISTT